MKSVQRRRRWRFGAYNLSRFRSGRGNSGLIQRSSGSEAQDENAPTIHDPIRNADRWCAAIFFGRHSFGRHSVSNSTERHLSHQPARPSGRGFLSLSRFHSAGGECERFGLPYRAKNGAHRIRRARRVPVQHQQDRTLEQSFPVARTEVPGRFPHRTRSGEVDGRQHRVRWTAQLLRHRPRRARAGHRRQQAVD